MNERNEKDTHVLERLPNIYIGMLADGIDVLSERTFKHVWTLRNNRDHRSHYRESQCGNPAHMLSGHTVIQPDRANVHAINEDLSRCRFQDAEQRKEKLSHKDQKE